MGYYTDYSLEIDINSEDKKIVEEIELFIKTLNNDIFCDLQDVVLYRVTNGKWYNYDADMLFLSNKFPKVMFTLKGIGEEYDDIWEKTYFGGEITDFHKAEMVNQFKNKKDKDFFESSMNQYIFCDCNNELYYLLNIDFDILGTDDLNSKSVMSKYEIERWLKNHDNYNNNKGK